MISCIVSNASLFWISYRTQTYLELIRVFSEYFSQQTLPPPRQREVPVQAQSDIEMDEKKTQ